MQLLFPKDKLNCTYEVLQLKNFHEDYSLLLQEKYKSFNMGFESPRLFLPIFLSEEDFFNLNYHIFENEVCFLSKENLGMFSTHLRMPELSKVIYCNC